MGRINDMMFRRLKNMFIRHLSVCEPDKISQLMAYKHGSKSFQEVSNTHKSSFLFHNIPLHRIDMFI